MSLATLVWSALWALTAAAACLMLLRASDKPELSVKNGYRWLAIGAGCLGAGAILQAVFSGLIGGAQPLRLADLVSLAALPAIVIGVATLTAEPVAAEPGRSGHGRLLRESRAVASAGPPQGIVLDSCLLVCSLFVICLVTLFGRDYATGDAGRAAFALALIRPAADLAAIGILLRFAVRSPRLALPPVFALTLLAVSDSLAVGDRIAAAQTGPAARICLIAALCLLTPLVGSGAVVGTVAGAAPAAAPGAARRANPWSSPATIAALAAATVAALVATGFSLGGGPVSTPVLVIAGSVVVLLLVGRLAGIARQASAAAASAQEYDWMFRALADTTGDAVMICDLVGTIEYVSQQVAQFGYAPDELTGANLADLVHPEDRRAGIRAAIAGLRSAGGTATFSGRVRGADGSWRHVESTLSRYGAAGEPARLLISSADVTDRVALRRQVTQLTFHDGLTGLPNRAYVEERALAAAGPVAGAILVDLDGYAGINGLIGSNGADLLLAQAGRRLRAAVTPPATVARWGSDEFAVLVGDASAGADVVELAEQLAGKIAAESFSVAGKEITMTASVGVATGSPESALALLGSATMALARAKEAGGGKVEVFGPALQAQALRRAQLAGELRVAMADNVLSVSYEPVAELGSGRIRDVEAIVSWPRPGEPVGPAALPAVAEESGLLAQLGEWVLGHACRQVAGWRAGGSDVGLLVTCASRYVTGPRFAASVLAALEASELPPEALMLEVAEPVLLDSATPVASALAGLRGKGVRLAIGSFGTGYGSLAFLRRSGVDAVKIHSSFVAGLQADPTLALLTRTIVRLAQDLGIEAIAEGIERPEQREQLEEMGCVLGQGPAVAAVLPAGSADAGPASGVGAETASQ
jgi:diguanylate cyclase (GGDEF)-like protein/PAS domain S-box-containing protein